MTSVTRDKKKYGAPTVYSETDRKRRQQEQRERELAIELERDITRGRRGSYSGRINPLFYDE